MNKPCQRTTPAFAQHSLRSGNYERLGALQADIKVFKNTILRTRRPEKR